MEEKISIVRQELDLVFIIDKSGSMQGTKIGAVNTAIREIKNILPEIQAQTADVDLKVSVLSFSDSSTWTNTKDSVESFKWNDLYANGGTALGSAYQNLLKFLNKKQNGGQMPDYGGFSPILILMTDGMPTDNWSTPLNDLRQKPWFRQALRYAISIEANTPEAINVLREFTGDIETVIKVFTAEALKQVIKVIAVTSSKVKSQSATVSNTTTSTGVNAVAKAEIKENLEELDDVEW